MLIVPIVFGVEVEPDLRQPDPTLPVDWAGWDAARPLLAEWRRGVPLPARTADVFDCFLGRPFSVRGFPLRR